MACYDCFLYSLRTPGHPRRYAGRCLMEQQRCAMQQAAALKQMYRTLWSLDVKIISSLLVYMTASLSWLSQVR